MKKIIILLLISFTSTASAQQPLEVCLRQATPAHIAAVRDSLSSTYNTFNETGRDSAHTSRGNLYAVFFQADGHQVAIQNDDYGIVLTGSFEALFPFWKKYFNTSADKNRVKYTGDRVREKHVSLFESNDMWRIRTY